MNLHGISDIALHIPCFEALEDGSESELFDIDVITPEQQEEDAMRAAEFRAAQEDFFAGLTETPQGMTVAELIAAAAKEARPLHEALYALQRGQVASVPWAPIPVKPDTDGTLPW